MRRFLTRIALFLAALGCTAFVADRAFTHLFREGHLLKSQWQYHMRDQHFGVTFIGSSRGWWNIDMNAIQEGCDVRAVSLANNHFLAPEILLSLKIFLQNGNTTDRIFLQVDHDNLNVDGEEFSSTAYDFLPYLEDSLVHAHFGPRSLEWRAMRYIPFWRYTVCNFKWGMENVLTTGRRQPLFDSTGTYFSNPKFYGSETMMIREREYAVGPEIQEIIALCEANDIELVFFMAPYLNLSGPPEVLDGPSRAVAAVGYTLKDYSARITGKEYFNDTKHINIAGGELFTHMLMDELICPAPATSDSTVVSAVN